MISAILVLHGLLCTAFLLPSFSRFLSGMHEYEVELQFTSGLLGYPDHTHDPWGAVDGNDPVFGGEREGALLPKPSTANSLSSNSSSREALPVGYGLM